MKPIVIRSTVVPGSFEYDYRYFDVDVNVVQNENILKSFKYNNCEVLGYDLSTLTDDYESYLASNTGFAIVNNIEFQCSGVQINLDHDDYALGSPSDSFTDYGALPFVLAEDVRTFLTFEFDHGAEKNRICNFYINFGIW